MNHNLADLAETLFEESGDALFLFEPDTERLLDVNSTAQRLTGMTRPQLLSLAVDYLFRSEAQGGVQRLRQAYRKTGLFHSQEGFLLRHEREGVWIPVNLTVARLHVEPRPLGLITARDVSVYRQAQAQLQQKDAELRQVLDSVSVYLWSMEVEGDRWRPRYISPAVERITGRPATYYLADPRRWWETLHPEDRPRLEAATARLLAERPPTAEREYRIIRPDGAVRWLRDSVSLTPRAGHPGGALRLDGVVTDVTERRQAEEALRRSEEKYRALVENLEQCVFLKDVSLRYAAANRPFCQALGRAEADILGRTDFDFYPRHLADKYRASDRRVLVEGRRVEEEEETFHILAPCTGEAGDCGPSASSRRRCRTPRGAWSACWASAGT
jgi:PAS domain S-box-containing protein